jgi:hypothetical protein
MVIALLAFSFACSATAMALAAIGSDTPRRLGLAVAAALLAAVAGDTP